MLWQPKSTYKIKIILEIGSLSLAQHRKRNFSNKGTWLYMSVWLTRLQLEKQVSSTYSDAHF